MNFFDGDDTPAPDNRDIWMEAFYPEFGILLGRFLQRLGWSQTDLASKIGTGQSRISDYVNRKVKPHRDTFERIMNAFELDGRISKADLDRLHGAYEDYGTRVKPEQDVPERILRLIGQIRTTYSDETLDAFDDTIFSLARLLKLVYELGYEDGRQQSQNSDK